MDIISLNDIKKIYGEDNAKTYALKGIKLDVKEGDMIAIMGTSGSGKSTLLNIIGCIDKPTEGEYILNENNVHNFTQAQLALARNRYFGFVFQSFNLLNDYNIIDNVSIPLLYSKKFDGSMKRTAIEMLEKVGLKDQLKKMPSELSGGQQQRVAIARALVNNPRIILADEPTGALDKKTSIEIMELFKEINLTGKTIIIVTHDNEVANYCSKIIKIEDGIII